jgi:hypothetical protein
MSERVDCCIECKSMGLAMFAIYASMLYGQCKFCGQQRTVFSSLEVHDGCLIIVDEVAL